MAAIFPYTMQAILSKLKFSLFTANFKFPHEISIISSRNGFKEEFLTFFMLIGTVLSDEINLI